jgi:predicted transcriptional regulator
MWLKMDKVFIPFMKLYGMEMSRSAALYWKSYSWLVRGIQRVAIIKVMDRPKMPSRISREAKQLNERINLNSTSDILRHFVKKGIAVCLNPDQKVGRLYELTRKGKKLREEIMKE